MKDVNLNALVRDALEAAGVTLNERRGARVRTDKMKDGRRVCRVNWVKSNDPERASKFLPKGFRFERVASNNKSNTWMLVQE